jgi:hypothetical protein
MFGKGDKVLTSDGKAATIFNVIEGNAHPYGVYQNDMMIYVREVFPATSIIRTCPGITRPCTVVFVSSEIPDEIDADKALCPICDDLLCNDLEKL